MVWPYRSGYAHAMAGDDKWRSKAGALSNVARLENVNGSGGPADYERVQEALRARLGQSEFWTIWPYDIDVTPPRWLDGRVGSAYPRLKELTLFANDRGLGNALCGFLRSSAVEDRYRVTEFLELCLAMQEHFQAEGRPLYFNCFEDFHDLYSVSLNIGIYDHDDKYSDDSYTWQWLPEKSLFQLELIEQNSQPSPTPGQPSDFEQMVADALRAAGLPMSHAPDITRSLQKALAENNLVVAPVKDERPRSDGALPTEAPETYQGLRGPETPPEFVKRVYGPWLGQGLTRAEIRKLDPKLAVAIMNWLSRPGNEWPADVDLPTKAEQNERLLSAGPEAIREHLGKFTGQEALREAERLRAAQRYRE